MIKLQASSGFWGSDSRAILSRCIEGGDSVDADVMRILGDLGTVGEEALELVYLTLLALFILEEAYLD